MLVDQDLTTPSERHCASLGYRLGRRIYASARREFMSSKQDRSNAYYEQVLKSKHPGVYADYLAGRYKSFRQALLAAGLKKSRSRVQEMQNAWLKASSAERKEFERWLRAQTGTAPRPSTMTTAAAGTLVAVNRRLEPWAKLRIETIIKKRHLSMGDVMAELDFPRRNGSLGNALSQGTRLQPGMLAALEKWIFNNAGI
jgi:hypothetical protein